MNDPNAGLVADLLGTWFGTPGDPEFGRLREEWFRQSDRFDALIRDRYAEAHLEAAAGRLDALAETPEGALALTLLLDQVPRNLHRDDPAAFATDAKARDVARHAISRGFDGTLLPVQRMFLYLPFMHSEDAQDQNLSVALCGALGPSFDETLRYAEAHRDIIRRFGRFPHRNEVLARRSTPEEIRFLETEGRGF